MYEYSIFWIKDEVAKHYFHKSDILYRFIKDYQYYQDRIDLESQFKYITKKFPEKALMSHLNNYYQRKDLIQIKGTIIEIYKNKNYISLHINEKHLKFRCKTLQDAEEILFPMLRQFQPMLFIVGNDIDNYGWISPVINSSKITSEQVLYSHL